MKKKVSKIKKNKNIQNLHLINEKKRTSLLRDREKIRLDKTRLVKLNCKFYFKKMYFLSINSNKKSKKKTIEKSIIFLLF